MMNYLVTVFQKNILLPFNYFVQHIIISQFDKLTYQEFFIIQTDFNDFNSISGLLIDILQLTEKYFGWCCTKINKYIFCLFWFNNEKIQRKLLLD